MNGDGDGDRAPMGTGVKTSKRMQNGNRDGSGDGVGTGTGTETGVETRGRTQDGNGDGSGHRNKGSSRDESEDEDGNGDGKEDGIGDWNAIENGKGRRRRIALVSTTSGNDKRRGPGTTIPLAVSSL